jgi:hypothetical protein
MITSARLAAFLRSRADPLATVTTIGGVTAAVKNGEFQSNRQDRESTATSTASGPYCSARTVPAATSTTSAWDRSTSNTA